MNVLLGGRPWKLFVHIMSCLFWCLVSSSVLGAIIASFSVKIMSFSVKIVSYSVKIVSFSVQRVFSSGKIVCFSVLQCPLRVLCFSYIATQPRSHIATQPYRHIATQLHSRRATSPHSHKGFHRWGAMQLCGYVATWLCSHVALQPCGYVALWLCSYVAMWPYVCVAMWLCSNLVM